MAVPTDRGPLARMLIRLREERDMTQTDLVRLCGGLLTAGHLGQVETGDRGMSQEKVDVVAKALKLSKAEREELAGAASQYRQRGRLAKAAAKSGIRIPEGLTPDDEARVQALIDKLARGTSSSLWHPCQR